MLEAIKKRLRAGFQSKTLREANSRGDLGFISASTGNDKGVNMYNTTRLAQDIQRAGGKPLRALGLTKQYGNERSFAVIGLSKEQILDLGKKYNQREVIYKNQLINTTPKEFGIVKEIYNPRNTQIDNKQIQHIKQRQKKGNIEDQTYLRNARTRIKLKT